VLSVRPFAIDIRKDHRIYLCFDIFITAAFSLVAFIRPLGRAQLCDAESLFNRDCSRTRTFSGYPSSHWQLCHASSKSPPIFTRHHACASREILVWEGFLDPQYRDIFGAAPPGRALGACEGSHSAGHACCHHEQRASPPILVTIPDAGRGKRRISRAPAGRTRSRASRLRRRRSSAASAALWMLVTPPALSTAAVFRIIKKAMMLENVLPTLVSNALRSISNSPPRDSSFKGADPSRRAVADFGGLRQHRRHPFRRLWVRVSWYYLDDVNGRSQHFVKLRPTAT
jgi:hypothetical protein